MSDIGKAIRNARKEKGLSQAEVAAAANVTQPTISVWERGKGVPDEQQRRKLEKKLGPLGDESPGVSGTVSSWLNRARIDAELSVSELSAKSGVSIPGIYALEAGRIANPRQQTLDKLAKALNVKFSDEDASILVEENTIEGLGVLTDFDPHNEDDVPKSAGIYVFYDISERPIYVGQSGSIKGRWKDHEQKFWFKRPIVSTAAYIEIKDKVLRKQVETLLIKFLKSNAVINQIGVDRDE